MRRGRVASGAASFAGARVAAALPVVATSIDCPQPNATWARLSRLIE
jgi:hypothetical protein